MHPSIFLLLLIGATKQTGDGPRLLRLLEAMHQPHSLPIEVILTLHRKQGMNPPGRRHAGVIGPPIAGYKPHQKNRHKEQEFPHFDSIKAKFQLGICLEIWVAFSGSQPQVKLPFFLLLFLFSLTWEGGSDVGTC